ncbi:MAG: 7-cyano-7-deazaguanine synthase [Vicinamibacterales bacterium]
MRRAIVLLSGGLDSYTAAAIAKAEGFTLDALSNPLRSASCARARGGASCGAGAGC